MQGSLGAELILSVTKAAWPAVWICVASICMEAKAADDPNYLQELADRRQVYLQWILDTFEPLEPMGALDGRKWSLNQARLFFNVSTNEANQHFESVVLTNDPDFMGIRLLKTLLEFGESGRLSVAAKAHIEEIIRGWDMNGHGGISRTASWPPSFTENHDLMYLTIGYFSEILRGENTDSYSGEFRKSLGWRFERGQYEWGSPRYQMHYTNPLQILAEHGPDQEIRNAAEDLFNIILAERALMSVGGYLGGPGMRLYGPDRGCDYLDNHRYDSFLPTVWVALGVGEPRFEFSGSGLEPAGAGYGNGNDPRLNQDEAMFFATGNLVPHAVVRELREEASQQSELLYVGRRAAAGHPYENGVPDDPVSHQVVYSYNTPHVLMGSLQYLPYAGKMTVSFNSLPRWFGIMFPGNPSQVLRTKVTEADRQAPPQTYTYVADRIVQHQNWLIAAGLLSESHGLTSHEVGGWNVYSSGQGLCSHIELPGGWHVFQVSDLTKHPNEQSFVSALSVPTIENEMAYGVTTDGDNLEVDLETMAITVNGVLREPQVGMLHDSQFMTSIFGSGEITIRTAARTVTYDGSKLYWPLPELNARERRWGNPIKSLGSTTTVAHARALGGLSPDQGGMLLKSVSLLATANDAGRVRLAVYAGGTLDGGPHAGTPATRLYDFGETDADATGWLTLEHPQGGVPLPGNTPIWIAWKGTGGKVHVAFHRAYEPSGGFQPDRGRWHSTAVDINQGTPWPAEWPGSDGGSFEDFWYSVYMTIQSPAALPGTFFIIR